MQLSDDLFPWKPGTKNSQFILLIPCILAPVSSLVVLFSHVPIIIFTITIIQVSFIFLPSLMLFKFRNTAYKINGSTLVKTIEAIGVITIITLELFFRRNKMIESGVVYSLPLIYLLLNIFNLKYKESLYPFLFISKNYFSLTPKEKEVIDYLKQGLGNKEIAYKLNISFSTVKNHIYNIYKKTGAQSRLDLVNRLKDSI